MSLLQLNGFILQIFPAALVTIKLAFCATLLGITIGLLGALFESMPARIIKYPVVSIIFIIRALPELLVIFFIYFGMTALLSNWFNQYIEINPFIAGVVALGLIFGAYASQV